MATVSFTPNLARLAESPSETVPGGTLRDALDAYFQSHPAVRGYVLDDQGEVRKHVAIFVNQEMIHDRRGLSDPLGDDDDIFVMQALSGG